MSRIILKWIDVFYSCFYIAEVNFKYVMLTIFEGAYKKLAPSCDFVSIPGHRRRGCGRCDFFMTHISKKNGNLTRQVNEVYQSLLKQCFDLHGNILDK